jgi:hypothetical protein
MDVDIGDLAEGAAVDKSFSCFAQMRRAAALESHLHGSIVFAGRRDHRLTFDDIEADRLLHIHVRACFACLNHGQTVPMIGRSDENDFR